MKKLIALILSFSLSIGFCACSNKKEESSDSSDTTAAAADKGNAEDNQKIFAEIAATTPSGTVSNGVFAYFLYDNIQYMEGLYQQYYGYEVDFSSSDYRSEFVDQTKTDIGHFVALTEEAKKRGIELDENEKASIDQQIDQFNAYASYYQQTLEEFLADSYLPGINEDILRECLTLSALAYKVSDQFYQEMTVSDDEIVTYRDAHPEEFRKAGIISYLFSAEPGTDATEEQKDQAAKDAEQKAQACFDNITDRDSFISAIRTLVTEEITKAGETPDETADYAASSIQPDFLFKKDDPISAWAFDEARQAGDKTVITTDAGSYVCFLDTLPYYDDYLSVSARHIILTYQDESTETAEGESITTSADALKEAQDILAEFNAGEKTEEAFGELAKLHSMDTSSMQNGGLNTGITKDEPVEDYAAWLFDESRQTGDTVILDLGGYYCISYFVGYGDSVWREQAKTNVENEKISAILEDLVTAYPVAFHDDAINKIP